MKTNLPAKVVAAPPPKTTVIYNAPPIESGSWCKALSNPISIGDAL